MVAQAESEMTWLSLAWIVFVALPFDFAARGGGWTNLSLYVLCTAAVALLTLALSPARGPGCKLTA